MFMINPSAKKKKQNINHELRLGGCAVLFMSPLIFIAFGMSIIGFLSLIISLIGASSPTYNGTDMWLKVMLGLTTAIYLTVGVKFIQRFRELYRMRYILKTEQERVAHMIDTSSAESRLKDHDLGLEQQKSPIDKPNRGHKYSF
jgi:hypothetical protein